MDFFLLLDASDSAITLCWDRHTEKDGCPVIEEVQMKKQTTSTSLSPAPAAGIAEAGSVDQQRDPEDSEAPGWKTLSNSLKTGALRKKNLEAATGYVFRRRARQDGRSSTAERAPVGQVDLDTVAHEIEHEWGPWSAPSEAFMTLGEGVRQAAIPVVKLREGGAVVMEWSAITGAKGYEVQMSTSGAQWATIALSFASTLLRKKGLEDAKQYRFRIRPVFSAAEAGKDNSGGGGGGGGGGVKGDSEEEWGWSPASAPASPAVLNAFLSSQVPRELVAGGGGGGGSEKGVVARTALAGKVIAFYFSASWCGPCRKYTPQLAQLYLAAKKQHKAFEVVFVSLDGDESSFTRYHAGMPWLAIPYDHPFREDFAAAKGVNSIPRLIVTGRDGQELASNAVGMTWDQLVSWEAQG